MSDREFQKQVRKFNVIKHAVGLVKDDNKKIQLIEELARILAYKTRGIYADEYLEKILCGIGSKIKVNLKDLPREGTVLHVVTKVGIMGGHTRVIDHWIQMDSCREHSLVVTAGAAGQIRFPQFLKDTIEESGGRILFLRSASHISRAKQLLEIAQKYDKIILHTYMEDAIPTLAFSNTKWKRTVYLFNHANFRFWLGTSVADVCLDITTQDAEISRNLRGIKKVKLLPIPMLGDSCLADTNSVVVKNRIREYYDICEQDKVVTTMANSYKYQTVPQYNFFDFVERLLKENKDIIFFAIGPAREEPDWKKLYERYPKRLHIMGILDKYRVNEILSITDLYVGSFPAGSATACLDAAIRGVRVVSLKTGEPSLDSLKNRAETVEDLICLIEGILDGNTEYKPDDLQAHLQTGWMKQLEEIYSMCPEHQIHCCKSKVHFGKNEKTLMSGLDKENPKYTETWTCHGELPMCDLDEKEYILPVEMTVWDYLFDCIYKKG